MKLNPSKCTFGVSSGRFLGYLVTQRGIEAHPNQIKAILNMKSPATTKEIQSLTGRVAALNRFLSRSTDKCRPFFKALKKGHKDKWDDECELSSYPRRAGGTTSGILHFKSSPRCRDSLSENGEAHFFACGFCEKVKALLSSTPDNCHNRISFEIDPSQPRRFSAAHEMGYRTHLLRQPKMVTKSKEKADDTSPTDSN
ncbi:unnamed protein product, partial [Prunus brigantina]